MSEQNEIKDLGAISAYAIAVENGYVGTEQEFGEYLATAADKAAQTVAKAAEAAQSVVDANSKALISEGYAVGKQNGVDVQSGSPYHEHNALYYAEEAEASAEKAEYSANVAGYMDFFINNDGYLVYRHTKNLNNVSFELREGVLYAVWP